MSFSAAIIKYHRLDDLGNRNLFSHNFRRLSRPRLDVLGIRYSGENPLPDSQLDPSCWVFAWQRETEYDISPPFLIRTQFYGLGTQHCDIIKS